MKLLFLTLLDFNSIEEHGIYQDLLREFVKNGHEVFAISPTERRSHQCTHVIKNDNVTILKLKIGNIQKTNIIEKGISTVLIEPIFNMGIKKYFSCVKFDLVMYSTPPITFYKAIKYIKSRDVAKSYLLLKDIFPQNAVDIGMMSTNGLKSLLYKIFRYKEKKLYEVSDYIGCMSQANVDYIIRNNPEINPIIVEVCPNCVDAIDHSLSLDIVKGIRKKYGVPVDKKVFIYGGNLGKPQGIPFLIECLRSQRNNTNVFFLIVGDGTEYGKLKSYINNERPSNVKLMKRLPKEDYDAMVGACDVGMIFLDYRFTIPNFPSRLLAYMQAKIPVFAITDRNTDVGKVIVAGGFGWWCEANNVNSFTKNMYKIRNCNLKEYQEQEWSFLQKNYTVQIGYEIIMQHFSDLVGKEGSNNAI